LVSLDDPSSEEASLLGGADKLIKPSADDNLRLRRTKKGDPSSPGGALGGSKDKDFDKGLEAFQQCYESCGVEWPLGSSGSSGSSGSLSSSSKKTWKNKPACCQGGVSAIKASYTGQNNVTFYIANHDSLGSFTVEDQCGVGGGSSLEPTTVRFADCNKCFPSKGQQNASLCDPATDIWDSIVVKNESDKFCLVVLDGDLEYLALNTKMPTDLKMFYQEGDTPGVVIPITFHTSCSKPVYPPYAIDLEACNGDEAFYIDLSLDGQPPSSLLKFEDGFGAKEFPDSMFSTCEIPSDKDTDQCCQGGSTFLKTKFGGSELAGILTLDPISAALYAPCVLDVEPSSKGPSQDDGLPVRFIPCSDECLLDPFSDVPCASSFDTIGVLEDEDVCFGKWDNVTSRLAYDSKMPTYLDIYLINEDGVFSARIHTSCSKPVYAPFAQGFSEACSEPLSVIDLSVDTEEELPIHLAFIDGISRKYFESASQLDTVNAENVVFDISFGGCGCFCGSDFPSFSPTYITPHSPSAQPSTVPGSPVSTPTLAPSSPPSSSPSQAPSAKLSESPSDKPSPSLSNTPSQDPSSSAKLSESPSDKPSLSLSNTPSQDPSSSAKLSESPSDKPSPSLSNTPSQDPSSQPTSTSQLSPGTPGGDCGNFCKDWVFDNCVFFPGSGTGDACDVDRVFQIDDQEDEQGVDELGDDGNRRRLLKSSMHALLTEENAAIGVWPLHEQIEYHREMAAFYKELLSSF
jgi:hypothetical protein